MDFTQHFVTRLKQLVTPQTEPIPDSDRITSTSAN
jgi:hypothetical protein